MVYIVNSDRQGNLSQRSGEHSSSQRLSQSVPGRIQLQPHDQNMEIVNEPNLARRGSFQLYNLIPRIGSGLITSNLQ